MFVFGNQGNRSFLTNYRGYVAKEWAGYYFAYDYFKSEYKKRKGLGRIDIQELDEKLLAEIRRVHRFLLSMVEAVDGDLDSISDIIDNMQSNNGSAQTDHNIELSLRMLYHKIHQCGDFFKLNHFAISKICKKMEKLPYDPIEPPPLPLPLQADSSPEVQTLLPQRDVADQKRCNLLPNFPSGDYFYDQYYSAEQRVEDVKQRCIDIYTVKFRRTYTQLAHYELEYIKNKDRNFKSTRFFIGTKLGLAICIFLWIIVDTNTTSNDLDFWHQPGLYVYTTIGNILLYRLGWAFQVYMWSKYDVNYISALQMTSIRPNLVLVLDQTATLLLIYSVNLLVFFKANSNGTLLYGTFLTYACPFLLIIAAICYQVYEYYYMFGSQRSSCGVFTREVVSNLISAPFVPVRFRDVYAADILTSFTRIISDSLYASCWVFSGTFLLSTDSNSATDFGSSNLQCTNHNMKLVTSCIQLLPLITRSLQCLRACHDGGWKVFPQGYNTLKYVLSMSVVMVAVVDTSGDFKALYTIIAVTTLYKWWWDVVMDWGLCEILPQSLEEALRLDLYLVSKMWLRKLLMYPSLLIYHFCVLVDLILRFAWVLSLLPDAALGSIVGYQLSFFLGSLEIIRRSMWGCLRIEWEHLKLMQQGAAGFLSTPTIREFGGVAIRRPSQKITALEEMAPTIVEGEDAA